MNNYTRDYTDEELRVIALPLAVKLVDQEVYRTLSKCNTNEISTIVSEFVNIMKYGSVKAPEVKDAVIENEVAPSEVKFG